MKLGIRAFGAFFAIAVVALPFRIAVDGFSLQLIPQDAIAKNGSESGKGKSDAGKGESGGKGASNKGATGSRGRDPSGKGKKSGSQPANKHVNPTTGDTIKVQGQNIRVEHPNGMLEIISNNRYEMKDARGRTIVKRRATDRDRARLRALSS